MRRYLITAACLVSFASPAFAQQGGLAPQPQKPVTYTLTPDQQGVLKRALLAADFWFGVRVQASPNSFEGRGFEMQRSEIAALFQVLNQQEHNQPVPAAAPTQPAPAGPVAPSEPYK